MILEAEKKLTSVEEAPYRAELVCSPGEICRLSEDASYLLKEQAGTRDPHVFLASIDGKAWLPRVVVIARAGSTVGIVYAKERRLAGIPSGLIYADATLGAMVLASPVDRELVLKAGLSRLIDHVGTRGLRVVVPPIGYERDVIQGIVDLRSMDVHYASVRNHCVLNLPPSYDAFLETLGRQTRRNFRYYRRRFESLGNTYFQDVPLAEFRRVASDLLKKSVFGAEHDGVERALRILSASRCPILAGLRHKNGEWLSILGGWYELDRAVAFIQMNNDRDYPRSALCTVLRGYLIERLIAKNISSLLFWAGVGGSLCRYCQFIPAVCAHMDVPTFTWRTLRGAIGWMNGVLPARFLGASTWVAPRMNHPEGTID